jgi:methionine synthase / methylenetetrahydrofolate reductase(NADPH)
MAKIPFLERLQGKVILGDGAMGTMLHQSGIGFGVSLDKLNLTDPAMVASIHRRYLEAGAEILETNTFSANDYKLREFGLQSETVNLNEAGVEVARSVIEESGRDDVYIGGSVGPLGVWITPIGRVPEDKAFTAFRKQIAALIFGGADFIMLETFSDISEIALAVQAARDVRADIPIVAQITFTRDDRTVLGDTPVSVAGRLQELELAAIGVNCSSGPSQLLRLASIFRAVVPGQKLIVQPNAGWPEQIGGRVAYPALPDYFGDYALAFADAGVSIIGGCCGTTPAHIAAMREALDDESRPHPIYVIVPKQEEVITTPASEQPTHLAARLAAGQFVTTVEVAPPRSFTAQRVIAAVEMLRDAGVDFINVSDAPLARMRMSPWAVAYLIQERVGMETVLHFPVRGRNLLRVQGDLLAAHAMDIRNIFVTMGDPSKIGDYPDAFDTHDVVPTGLISLLQQRFNQGLDQAGNSIGQPTHFNIGAAVNLIPPEMEKELKLTRKKLENGANFLLSQPVFEPYKIQDFLNAYEELYGEPLKIPIIAGLLPLYTARHAAFLHNEVPGIHIPEELQKRIEGAEDAAKEGVKIAQEILLQLREVVHGAYLMPPFGRYYLAAEVVDVLSPEAMEL